MAIVNVLLKEDTEKVKTYRDAGDGANEKKTIQA